jgi:ADP-ribose pyrophosphatase YjhB (NUDIX family)
MKDLSIVVEDGYKFNYRTAAFILHDNKLLMHKSENGDYYTLPGGRVKIGENSMDGIKREISEEINKEINIFGTAAIIENIFDFDKYLFHEILFVHNIKFVDEDLYKRETIHGREGEKELEFTWVDVDNPDLDIKPICLKKLLQKENLQTQYIINYDK